MKNCFLFLLCVLWARSVCVCVWEEEGGRRGKGGWLKGGGAEPRKVGEPKGGGQRVGRRKAQNFALRSPFPGANFVLSSLSGGLLVELWPWFEAVGHPKCSFGLLCEPPEAYRLKKGNKTAKFLAVQRRGFQRHKEHTPHNKKKTQKKTHTRKTKQTHTHTHKKTHTKTEQKKENISSEKNAVQRRCGPPSKPCSKNLFFQRQSK